MTYGCRAWQNRIVDHGEVDPRSLVPHPRNWRRHPRAQRKALAGALSEIGWVASITVNRRTGRLVDGHARVEEAIGRGETTVPVVYVDLDEREETVALASFDPLGAMATPDREALDALLAEVKVGDEALAKMLTAMQSTKVDIREIVEEVGPEVSIPERTCPKCGYRW